MADSSRDISLGQFVKQLAALLNRKGVKLPFKDQRPWHLLFYELAKLPAGPQKPQFLDELIFDWDAPDAKCQALAEFLQALHFTASVSASNPRFDAITVDSAVADRWSKQFDQNDPALKEFFNTAMERAEAEFAQAA